MTVSFDVLDKKLLFQLSCIELISAKYCNIPTIPTLADHYHNLVKFRCINLTGDLITEDILIKLCQNNKQLEEFQIRCVIKTEDNFADNILYALVNYNIYICKSCILTVIK